MIRRGWLLSALMLLTGFVAGWWLPLLPARAAAQVQNKEPIPKAPAADGKLRIIAFGAHPDGCHTHHEQRLQQGLDASRLTAD